MSETCLFDKLTSEEIHALPRQEDIVMINRNIAEYFIKSDRFDTENEYKEILEEAETYKNPYAVKRIAEYYRDGSRVLCDRHKCFRTAPDHRSRGNRLRS